MDLDLVFAALRELFDSAHEPELVERRRDEVAHDALDIARDRVHFVGEAFQQLPRRQQGVVDIATLDLAERGPQTHRDSVGAGPSPSCRSRRNRRRSSSRGYDGDARSPQVGSEPHPADRSPSGPTSSARTCSSRARNMGPYSQPTTRRPTTSPCCSNSTVRGRWSRDRARPAASRRASCKSLTSMATKSSRRSRCRLSASDGSSSSPESAPTCSTTRARLRADRRAPAPAGRRRP